MKPIKDLTVRLLTLENPYEDGTRQYNTFEDIKGYVGLDKVSITDLAKKYESDIFVLNGNAIDYYESHDSIESLIEDGVLADAQVREEA